MDLYQFLGICFWIVMRQVETSHFRRMCLEIFRIKGEGSDGHDCYDKKFPDFDCIFQTENWRNN